MDAGRWKHVEALFHEALERPPHERKPFLRQACRDDRALYDEVIALLEADATPHSILEGRAIDAAPGLLSSTLAAGTRVGPYQVVSSVGTGGMGVVYLADRADGQFEQRVALKLIKRGMDSDLILSRFHAERRILARLRHPNIASLLDGGVTDDGLPYFTMEYVDGQPITQYCDERQLPIEDRLRLFQSVCAAVQYAHGNLVVHRDLKPSNILVTTDGHAKLLDFGIARVLDDSDDGLTRSGQRVMTPAYASPEQVRGEPVTTASDVYSLGVVLYELLCGRHPHRDTTSTPAELERAIAETQPERPSRFLSQIATVASKERQVSLETVARARRLAPVRLRRRLQGDLDNICLAALRKEPERRYASPGQLHDDIQRHLSGRPVTARPDTVRYRFGKFVRRNRVGVAAATALVVLVTVLTLVYTTRLAHERDRARVEAAKAAEVSAFLGGLFKAADPYTSRGESITARELLDEGRGRVHGELAGQPGVLADMLETIGVAYGNLGVYDESIASLEESVSLRRQLDGDQRDGLVKTTVALLSVLSEVGRYEEADSLGEWAVEVARGIPNRARLAEAVFMLGLARNYRGVYEDAERLYRESITIWQKLEGPDSPSASPIMNDLGLLCHEQSRYAEADSMFRMALAIQEKVYGKRHPETATTRYNYAQLLGDRGKLTEARIMWDEVLANDRALYPQGHPAIAFTLSAYGKLLSRLGAYAEAEALQREALAIRREFHGDEHPDVAYSIGALGYVLLERGYYDEAEARLREARAMHVRLNGSTHPIVCTMMNAIGRVQSERGDYAAADTSFAHSLALQRAIAGGEERNQMWVSLVQRGTVLSAMGRVREGEALAREGLGISERLHGREGMAVAHAKVELGFILLQAGSLAEADSLFAEALDQKRALEEGAPARPRDCEALLGLGRCRQAAGDIDAAEERFREALAIGEEYLHPDHPMIARARIALARALLAKGDTAAAEVQLRSAIDVLSEVVLPGQVDLVEAHRALSD